MNHYIDLYKNVYENQNPFILNKKQTRYNPQFIKTLLSLAEKQYFLPHNKKNNNDNYGSSGKFVDN
jgi:hypothetical protein